MSLSSKRALFSTFLAAVVAMLAAPANSDPPPWPIDVIEYYSADLDHFFVTANPTEIGVLDSGALRGWSRTGQQFLAYAPSVDASLGAPVCRYYGLASAGLDSHFFSGFADECAQLGAKYPDAWVLEATNVFRMPMPDGTTGDCPAETSPVYRLYNNRPDADHRFTTDANIRVAMISRGYIPEGYGSDGVGFCAVAPSSNAGRIRVSGQAGGTDFVNVSANLKLPWTKPGGDYIDKNGVLNGPAPHASATVTWGMQEVTIDISRMSGDLLLRWSGPIPAKFGSVKIDGAEASAFWVDASTSHPIGAPYSTPGFVRNVDGKKLTLTLSNLYQPGALLVDPVALPTVPALPMTGPSNKPTILELDLKNSAAIDALIKPFDIAQPFAYNPEFGADNGMPYLRFSSVTANQRLISWFLRFPAKDKVNARYALYIEDDVADGMNELGMKLPGLAGDDGISWRMEHGMQAPENRGLYGAADYRYSVDSGGGFGTISSMNTVLQAGRWYVIEQRAEKNTITNGVANPDGVAKVWINGHLAYQANNVRWTNSRNAHFNYVHVNVYHGGLGFPKAPFHYRIARIGISDDYIGAPAELVGGAVPDWRKSAPKGKFTAIPGTARMNDTTSTRATVDAWNGFAAGPDAWYSALNGGHSDSAENKVLKLDLSANAPRWVVLDGGSSGPGVADALYYPDGRPAARHTYYDTQYIRSRNRVMTFGASAVWGTGNGGGPVVDGFDLGRRKWDAQGTWPLAPFNWTAQSVARNPATDDVYIAGHNVFATWSPSSASWSMFTLTGSPQYAWEFGPTLVDTKRNRLVHLYDAKSMGLVDLTTYASTVVPLTGDLASISDYMQLAHDKDNDRYLLVHGTGVYALDPDTGVTTLVATVPAAVNGAHNRFAYFEQLGGVAYLPEFNSDVLFMSTR